jgi:ribonuclease HI
VAANDWVAYTDGACAPSNPGPSGWGAVLVAPDGTTETDHYGFIGPGTNQIAELTAAIEGLTLVPAGETVELVSDSQYVLKGISEWRAGWERKGWKNSKGEPVANLALWKKLFALAARAQRRPVQRARRCTGQPGAAAQGPQRRPARGLNGFTTPKRPPSAFAASSARPPWRPVRSAFRGGRCALRCRRGCLGTHHG